MPTYTVTDPQTNKTLKLVGDSPPTEAELVEIFAAQAPVSQDPYESLAASQREAGAAQQLAIAEQGAAPSPIGSFVREGVRSIGPGLAGFASGAATGAGMGAMGAGPIGAGIGAVVMGIGGAMGAREIQDGVSDAVAPGSFMGTESAALDWQTNPKSSLVGGALAQGRPGPMRAIGAVRNIATAEGRGLLAKSVRAGASPAASAALSETIDVGLGAGIGAGMSAATGDGMTLENAALGAIFNRPWIGGRPGAHPQTEAPPVNPNTGMIPVQPEVIRGPVTRMGNGEMTEQSPWMVRPSRGLPAPETPAGFIPAPEPAQGLPAPVAGRKDSAPIIDIQQREAQTALINSLDEELSANRSRREELVTKFKERGQPINKGVGRRMIDILDKRASELQSKIEGLIGDDIITAPAKPREIVEVDNRQPKPGPIIEVPAISEPTPTLTNEAPPIQSAPVELPLLPLPKGVEATPPEAIQRVGSEPAPEAPAAAPVVAEPVSGLPEAPERRYARGGTVKSGGQDFVDFMHENPINMPKKAGRTGGEFDPLGEFHKGLPPLYKVPFKADGGSPIDTVVAKAFADGHIPEQSTEALLDKYSKAIANRKLIRETGDLNPLEIKARALEVKAPRQAKDFDTALITNRRSRAGEKVLAGDLAEGEAFQFQGEPFKVTRSEVVEGFDGPEGLVVLQDHDKFGTQIVDASQPLRIGEKDTGTVWPHESDRAQEVLSRRAPADSEEIPADAYDTEDPGSLPAFLKQKPEASEPLTLETQTPESIKAEKSADARKAEMEKGIAKPLKGTAGDTTADIFGEGETPLFNERRDNQPAQKQSFIDGLKAHRDRVNESIKKDSGSLYMNPFPQIGKTAWRDCLDVAIATLDAGGKVAAAVKAALAHVKSSFPHLADREMKAIERRLYSEANDQRKFNSGRDAQFKVEMPKVVGQLEARGVTSPTMGQLIAELTNRFPDQAGYIRKNADLLFDEMTFQRDLLSGKDQPAREWSEWLGGALDQAAKVSEWAKKGTPFRDIADKLNLFNKTVFGTIANKGIALADGRINGRESKALKKFMGDLFGKRPGANGVHDISHDLELHTATKAHQTRLQAIEDQAKSFTSKLPKAERAAFWERVTDHITDPSRDHELTRQPELKAAVDGIIRLRRELYDMKIAAGVDMGDVGPRSMPRRPDTARILGNEKEFVAQAAKAYEATWKREIAKLNVERAAAKAAGDKAKVSRIDSKIGEIDAQDSAVFAEKYLFALKSDDIGISSDGEGDLFTPHNGKPNTEKSRVFGPEADQLLGKFYERSAIDLMMKDVNDAHRAATVAKLLSGKNADGTIDPLGGWKKLRAEMEAEGNRDSIPLAAEIVKHYFNLGGHENPTARKLLELAHSHTQIGRLSHAMMASFGDPTLIGMRHGGGVASYANAYAGTAKRIYQSMKGASPDEWRIVADFMGLSSGGLNSLLSASRHMDAYGGRLGGKLISRFHILTGLTHLTNATHATALEMGHSHILGQLEIAKGGGKLANLSRKLLNEVGISGTEIDDVLKFAKKLQASPDKSKLLTADTPEAAKYRKALHLFRNSGATLEPTRGARPEHANHPLMSLYYQLSSFLYDFHDKVTMRGLRNLRDAYKGEVEIDGANVKLSNSERYAMAQNTLVGFAAVAATAYGVQTVREALLRDPVRAQKDKKRTASEIQTSKLMSAGSRTGFLGPYDALFNIITGARYNRDPSSAFHGAALGGAFQMTGNLVRLLNEQYEDAINDRTTPRSNVNARKFGRDVSDMIVTPAINAFGSTLPGGAIPAAIIQGASHPAFRETVTKALGGPMRIQK